MGGQFYLSGSGGCEFGRAGAGRESDFSPGDLAACGIQVHCAIESGIKLTCAVLQLKLYAEGSSGFSCSGRDHNQPIHFSNCDLIDLKRDGRHVAHFKNKFRDRPGLIAGKRSAPRFKIREGNSKLVPSVFPGRDDCRVLYTACGINDELHLICGAVAPEPHLERVHSSRPFTAGKNAVFGQYLPILASAIAKRDGHSVSNFTVVANQRGTAGARACGPPIVSLITIKAFDQTVSGKLRHC